MTLGAEESEIAEFLAQGHIFTLAVARNNEAYCASCFYVFDPRGPDFVFLTDPKTRHGREMLANPRAAGTVHRDTRDPDQIQGVQITGVVRELGEEEESLRDMYLRAFPFARGKESTFWALRADFLKMTDNRISFGYKRIWRAPASGADDGGRP